MGLTYEQAGVNIAAGNALVKAIGPLAKSTRRPGADAELGGFGGFFDLKAAGYTDPLLVAANDGVGSITVRSCLTNMHHANAKELWGRTYSSYITHTGSYGPGCNLIHYSFFQSSKIRGTFLSP